MNAEEFQALRADPHPMLGVSMKIVPPTGRYDSDRLLNVASNRWAVKPEIGSMIPITSKLLLEIQAGIWLFGHDDRYLPGNRRQEPILSMEMHLVRRFQPGFWASLDANFFTGGRQTIGGQRLGDVLRNSRLGATLVVPFARRHAVKLGYATGIVTNFGTNFDQYLIGYKLILN